MVMPDRHILYELRHINYLRKAILACYAPIKFPNCPGSAPERTVVILECVLIAPVTTLQGDCELARLPSEWNSGRSPLLTNTVDRSPRPLDRWG
ncbi:Hypothetical predicted protein [Pelobates cultripes]|uniref:Uncharacterized protein n=1 Tax=Pelobates cultripes TaxID=61616 RepID=A0AAD1VV92_PELCU|nr:Hypothetical predicted protein [Pelobates cultripes]